ncbi:ABC transporter ATP-binding protein [uncultured Microbacterium sp.]|uniref:ABC transporter ATP-binding protein n=1 Tax=uncultured Microbacterium sp. TaxID=191216 RepID=UPI0025DBF016|nr:ATP-binding cassette domain-containing protein [uncultured Microbacterium sp.]
MAENTVEGTASPTRRNVLRIEDLAIDYRQGFGRTFRAVQGITLDIAPGETVGLVGESGSGKSTIGNAVLGLQPPAEGSVQVLGEDVALRGRRSHEPGPVQVVLQNPYRAFNPFKSIAWSLLEPLTAAGGGAKPGRDGLVSAALAGVGLDPSYARRYPRELSGGQLQRVAIARSLISDPALIVCDEPVSSLDASVCGQVLNLLTAKQRERELAYLFISHDMNVVRLMCDRVYVLYRGRIVEQGSTEKVFADPQHEYTRKLIAAIPDRAESLRQRAANAV